MYPPCLIFQFHPPPCAHPDPWRISAVKTRSAKGRDKCSQCRYFAFESFCTLHSIRVESRAFVVRETSLFAFLVFSAISGLIRVHQCSSVVNFCFLLSPV